MRIGDYELVQTCSACPEQYDVFLNDEKVGYLRLRHGWFEARCNGDTVYESQTNGDGIFEDDERMVHLKNAVLAIFLRLEAKMT